MNENCGLWLYIHIADLQRLGLDQLIIARALSTIYYSSMYYPHVYTEEFDIPIP